MALTVIWAKDLTEQIDVLQDWLGKVVILVRFLMSNCCFNKVASTITKLLCEL